MHLLALLLVAGVLYQEVTGGFYLHPYLPCHDDSRKNARSKRSELTSRRNTEDNQLHPVVNLRANTDSDYNHMKGIVDNRITVPENQQESTSGHSSTNDPSKGNGKGSEVVGLGPLAHILAARARAHAIAARARLHHPLLLEETPDDFLGKTEHPQKHFRVPDTTLTLEPPNVTSTPKHDHQHVSTHSSFAKQTLKQSKNPPSNFTRHSAQNRERFAQTQLFDGLRPVNLEIANTELQFHEQDDSFQSPFEVDDFEEVNVIPDEEENIIPDEEENVIPDEKANFYKLPGDDFSDFDGFVAEALENSDRLGGYYENQYQPNFPAKPVGGYDQQPEVIVHNIDNSEEVYQNLKPGFSIIPTNWKPPPESSLYFQGDYQPVDGQEPILAILPGKWINDDGLDSYYCEDYEIIPITYNIPDEVYGDGYGRSADSEDAASDTTQQKFIGVKKQLQGWEKNAMVWRPDSGSSSSELPADQPRAADPSDKRHFKGHSHSHVHTFIHQHIHHHGQPVLPSHASGFQNPHFVQPITHIPVQQSEFSQSHAQAQNFGFSPHGPQITINKQKTMVVVPPGGHQNVEIAQVAGNNNALSQSQASNRALQNGFVNGGFLPQTGQNFQASQVIGNNNAVSQSQASNQAPFFRRESEGFLGAPYLINFPRRSNVWRTNDDFPSKPLRKRSVDNSFHNGLEATSKISKNAPDVFARQSKLLKEIQETAKDDKELLFITEMGSNLLDNFKDILKPHTITKRTVPLLRLIIDPNAKLDVSKTLENMGTVARNSFESKRAPMYHLKNAAGSAKDAVLSGLRVLPQDFLVPSRYKIIDREKENLVTAANPRFKSARWGDERVGAINRSLLSRARLFRGKTRTKQNTPKEVPVEKSGIPREPEDPHNFSETYKKVGSMLRQSIQSGHETMAHMGEIYHSLRKALATTRHVAPKAVLSGMRIPAVQRNPPLLPTSDNLLLIAPKILQYKQEAVGAPHYSDNMEDFVGVGHIMNSLGISNPDADNVEFKRIVLHPADIGGPMLERSRLLQRPVVPDFQTRSSFAEEESPVVDMKELKKYFVLADTLKQGPSEEAPEEDVQETMDALENAREAVGANNLKEFLLQMKYGLSNLFKDKLEEAKSRLSQRLGKDLNYSTLRGEVSLERERRPPVTTEPASQNAEVGDDRDQAEITTEKGTAENKKMDSNATNETVGAGLLLPKQLLKPFMGRPSKNERRHFFEEYGDSIESSEENQTDDTRGLQQPLLNGAHLRTANAYKNDKELIGAINPIIFSKDFDPYGGESPFKFVAVENATKHDTTYETTTGKNKCSDVNECNSTSATTMRSTQTTIERSSEQWGSIESTAQNISEENAPKTIKGSVRVGARKYATRTNTEQDEKGSARGNIRITESSAGKNKSTDELGTSMKMGKALLTPFMGKPTKKEIETYLGKFDESYEEESDENGYLGISEDMNPDELQALSNGKSRKESNRPSRKPTFNQQNNLDNPLDQNVL